MVYKAKGMDEITWRWKREESAEEVEMSKKIGGMCVE